MLSWGHNSSRKPLHGHLIFKCRTFMLTALALLTLWKLKNKNVSVFRCSLLLHTLEHSMTDQIQCIVSQLVEAYTRGIRNSNSRHRQGPVFFLTASSVPLGSAQHFIRCVTRDSSLGIKTDGAWTYRLMSRAVGLHGVAIRRKGNFTFYFTTILEKHLVRKQV
jgi:hypothetical protein